MARMRLAEGALELEVLPELGGRIRRLRAFGHDLLRATDDQRVLTADPYSWGCYPMVPWCNRVPGGRLVFEGTRRQLPAEFEGHAIHGRGVTAAWTVASPNRLELRDPGDDCYPWPYWAWQEFELDSDTVRIALGVENTGKDKMPAGLGIHPWFDATERPEVRLPADLVYPSMGSCPLPGDPVPVVGADDLRTLGVPAWGLDEIWTGVTEQRIDLHWPTWGMSVGYRFTPNCDHVVLATIKELDAVAVEPQTHATDGHRRREAGERGGIGMLEPGERLQVEYHLEVRRD